MGVWLKRDRRARRRGQCRLPMGRNKMVRLTYVPKEVTPSYTGRNGGEKSSKGNMTYRKCGSRNRGKHWRLNFV